ncbi:unnamed protein product [Timema podura]|uniref:Uncharacterized protein n=1 Tax=Timema podura TaxID=61482 RepID=A0ABN7NEE9_TIMPD|nr:unnamed protein product [Timema podura]
MTGFRHGAPYSHQAPQEERNQERGRTYYYPQAKDRLQGRAGRHRESPIHPDAGLPQPQGQFASGEWGNACQDLPTRGLPVSSLPFTPQDTSSLALWVPLPPRKQAILTERPPPLAMIVPTLADRGCHVVSTTESPAAKLIFTDKSYYLFIQISPHEAEFDPVPDQEKFWKFQGSNPGHLESDSIKIISSNGETERRLGGIKRRLRNNINVQYPRTNQDPFLNSLSTLSSDTALAERHDQGIYRAEPTAVALMSQKDVSTGFQHLIKTQNRGVNVKYNLSPDQPDDERNKYLQPTTTSSGKIDERVIVTPTESQKVSYLRKREETTNLQEASIEKRDQYTVVDQDGKVSMTSKRAEPTSVQDATSRTREQCSIEDLNPESRQWRARLSRDSQRNFDLTHTGIDSMYPLSDISPKYRKTSGVNAPARREKEKNKQFIINELRKIINETSQDVEAEKHYSELLRQAVNENGKRAKFDSQSGSSQSNMKSGQLVKRRAMNKPSSKKLINIGRDERTNLKRNMDFVNKFSNYCTNKTFMGSYKRDLGKAFPLASLPRTNEASEAFARKIEEEIKELEMLRNNLRGGNGETDVSISTSSIRDLMDKKNKTEAFAESKIDRSTFDGTSYNTTTSDQPDINKMNAVTLEDSRRTPNTAASFTRSRQYLCEQYKLFTERLCTRARRHHGQPPQTRKTSSDRRTRQVYIPPQVIIEFNEPSRLQTLRRNFQRRSPVYS